MLSLRVEVITDLRQRSLRQRSPSDSSEISVRFEGNNYSCSSGSSKIKGTASGIYPIPLRISGQYLYPSGSSSTSWGIYIYRPGSHAHFLGNIYIHQEVS